MLAKAAFKVGDAAASRRAHDGKTRVDIDNAAMEKHGGSGSEYIKSIIYGGLDGIVTTFAVVAASAGANLGSDILLLMGFASLFADGNTMSFGRH